MKRFSLAICLLVLIFAPVNPLSAQSGGEPLLGAAKDFERDNRFDDAVRQYETLIGSRDASAEIKLEATIRLGRIYLDVRGDIPKAQQYFVEGKGAVRFPDLAAQASVYLGKSIMVKARTDAEFSRALSEFDTVIRAYPNSPALVDALMAGGSVLELQHKFEGARIKYQSIVFGFPNSPVAPTAFMSLGRTLTRLGSIEDALKDYQNVQRLYGDKPVATIAKQHATLLYQLFILRGRTQAQVARKSETFKLDNPERMDWIGSSGLQIVDSDRAFAVSAAGAVSPAATPSDFMDSTGGAYRLMKKSIVVPGPKTITPVLKKEDKSEQFGEITAVATNQYGDLIIATTGPDGVYRVNRETGESTPLFPVGKKARKILSDSEGNFYILDDNQTAVTIVDWQGKSLAAVSAVSAGLKELTDFALDTFDNLYLLDKEGQFVTLGGITVGKSAQLKPLHKQEVSEKSADKPNAPAKPLKNLRAIAVSPTGAVYVATKEQVLSFQ